MTILLKNQWTNLGTEHQAECKRSDLDIWGYAVLCTEEVGNILCVHTNSQGVFLLGVEKVQELFHTLNCHITLTCYPGKHYQLHREIAESLNIMFPDVFKPITFNPTKYYPDITVGVR